LEPLVSVVIPTRERPGDAARAARSALAQSVHTLETIVVIDGPDAGTRAALEEIDDPRLTVLPLQARRGPGGARNAGVRACRAEWVAFLDDDDRWHPRKLELQLAAARASPHRWPVVACRLLAGADGRGSVLPRRLPDPGEPLSEYLFSRRGQFWGEALVQTSTVLARRELLERVHFRDDLPKHEDWDWLLRATAAGAQVVFVPTEEPLATWSAEGDRARASTRPDWRFSRRWLGEVAALVTPRAYASFLLAIAGADGAAERSFTAFWSLPWEALRRGRPRGRDLVVFLGAWLVPRRARAALGRALG
jgi:glycosyltransferase involved in cell wall biosynthesis